MIANCDHMTHTNVLEVGIPIRDLRRGRRFDALWPFRRARILPIILLQATPLPGGAAWLTKSMIS